MVFVANLTPRPYIVTILDEDENTITEHVLAYDLGEAVMTANMRASAKGIEVKRLLSVEPDSEAAALQHRQEASEALDLLRSISGGSKEN